jgi:hypothetical protein
MRHQVTSIRDVHLGYFCRTAHLGIETRVRLYCGRFAPGMARPLFEFVNLIHARAGRQYLPVRGDLLKATYRILAWSLRSRYGPIPV